MSSTRHSRKTVSKDFVAGITGAVVGIPQAMGFALIAGVSPIYGLYTAIISTLIGGMFSSSSLMTIAPTNALVLVVFSTLHTDNQPFVIEKLFVLTLLVGVFQLAFGLLRLGDLTRFVSNAVMTGFITGAGFLIILGQLPNLTGYVRDASVNNGAIPKFIDLLSHSNQWQISTLVVGLSALIIIVAIRQLPKYKIFAAIIAITFASVISIILGLADVKIVSDVATIPSGLPYPTNIIPNLEHVVELLPAALSMAILALVQGAGIAHATSNEDGQEESDINHDFMAQGLANMVGSFFQSMPSGGSLSRTAVNIDAGAKTRLSNIFAAGFIAIALLTLGQYIEHIVLAALAAQLIVTAYGLIDLERISMVWNVSLSGRVTMIITLLATLVMPLEYSIYAGVALSLALYVYTSSQNLEVVMLESTPDNQFHEAALPKTLPDNQAVVFSIHGHLYFAAVQQLQNMLPDAESGEHHVVILRLRHNQYMGSTGIRFVCQYAHNLEKHGGRLILAGVGTEIQHQLERTGTLQQLGEENVYYANGTILSATTQALAEAHRWLEVTSHN